MAILFVWKIYIYILLSKLKRLVIHLRLKLRRIQNCYVAALSIDSKNPDDQVILL